MSGRRVPGMTARKVRTLYLVPSPATPGLTAAERLALTLRRDATVSGSCVCGATMPKTRARRGTLTAAVMKHETDCPAADGPCLRRMVTRLGRALEYEQVVVELEVAS